MCWLHVDAGRAAVWFSTDSRVEKGDLVVILGLHGETDGWLLTVEVLYEVDANTCSNRGILGFRIKIYILSV